MRHKKENKNNLTTLKITMRYEEVMVLVIIDCNSDLLHYRQDTGFFLCLVLMTVPKQIIFLWVKFAFWYFHYCFGVCRAIWSYLAEDGGNGCRILRGVS